MANDLAKSLGASLKKSPKLIGAVERHLLAQGFMPDGRRTDRIHPSEVAHEDWCPRATYYRISGVTPEPPPKSITMEVVFETGNDGHSKWQRWFDEIGVLGGMWECTECQYKWEAVSPRQCPQCKHRNREHFKYREVPAQDDFYLLFGHLDGYLVWDEVEDDFDPIEIKTIGTGTVRIEAPKLVERYSFQYEDESGEHTGTNWQALWAGIRHPFASHLRQGMVYLFMTGWPSIRFIYEPKFLTGYPKEFLVTYQEGIVEPILEKCLVVKSSLEKERPPKRPIWAEETAKTCTYCPFKKTCYGNSRRYEEDRQSSRRSQSSSRQIKSPASAAAH